MPMFPRVALRAPCLSVAVAAALSPVPVALAADAGDAGAAERATTLDRLEVHGRRPPATVETPDQARRRLARRAGGTGVVDGDSYRDGRVGTLTDALGQATGVFVQSRFGAEEARVSIRGSGLQRTFHGRGIEVLQDGSPLNLADGSFDMQAIEPLASRHIAVYRGANALEFGAATLGGAIDFVSPTGYTAPAAVLRLEAGSDGYRRGQLAVAGRHGAADGYLSLSTFEQDGFRDHARQNTWRVSGNAGYRFGDTLDGRVYLAHVDTGSELPGNLTLAQARERPRMANPGNLALDQRRDFTLTRIAGRLAWTPSAAGTLLLSAFHSDKSLHHPIYQVLEQDSRDDGLDLRWRGEGELAGRRDVLVAGVAFSRGEVRDDRFVNADGQAGARTNRLDQRARTAKLYLENQTWLDARWALSLGAQALHSSRRSRDRYLANGVDESFDLDFSGASPKLGLLFQADPDSQFYGNLSGSLEPPSFGEITGGAAATLVDEQRARTFELGWRTRRERLSADLSLYRARVRGELLALTDGNGTPLGTVNADRTRHQGVEFGLGWSFAAPLAWSVNWLYNDFRFDGDPVYGDNALAGIPPQQLRTALRWQVGERFHVTPNAEWVPQDYYVDHANSFRAPGYHLLGLRLGGSIGPRWDWFVDARNLQDRRWISTTNVVADAGGRDAANFLPGDGRSVYAGVEWRLP